MRPICCASSLRGRLGAAARGARYPYPKLTRQLIEGMLETRYPFSPITKSSPVERDFDLAALLSEQQLVSVHPSLTPLEPHLQAKLDPRATLPQVCFRAMRRLGERVDFGGVVVAPMIPWNNCAEMEVARDVGAAVNGYPAQLGPLLARA
jgi:DNA repair photolyase